jgi:hypothetical protein
METSASSVGNRSGSLVKAIATAGLIAGTLDLLTASAVAKLNPVIVCQYIASGAFGSKDAFAGGYGMALWGLMFHYLIAYSWTTLFFLIYPKIKILSRSRVLAGLGYGVVVWIVMNKIVVPMSLINQRPFDLVSAAKQMAILMVMIGLPVSFLAHRFYSTQKSR